MKFPKTFSGRRRESPGRRAQVRGRDAAAAMPEAPLRLSPSMQPPLLSILMAGLSTGRYTQWLDAAVAA